MEEHEGRSIEQIVIADDHVAARTASVNQLDRDTAGGDTYLW
jgi:hypothetical protein